GRWDPAAPTTTVDYEFDFVHEGLMRAVLSAIGSRAGDAAEYWKYGVWVYDAASRGSAIVEQQMTGDWRGRIRVQVQGERSGRLLGWIRELVEQRAHRAGCKPSRIEQDGAVATTWLERSEQKMVAAAPSREPTSAEEGASERDREPRFA